MAALTLRMVTHMKSAPAEDDRRKGNECSHGIWRCTSTSQGNCGSGSLCSARVAELSREPPRYHTRGTTLQQLAQWQSKNSNTIAANAAEADTGDTTLTNGQVAKVKQPALCQVDVACVGKQSQYDNAAQHCKAYATLKEPAKA